MRTQCRGVPSVSTSTVELLSVSSWLFTTDNLLREGTRDRTTKARPVGFPCGIPRSQTASMIIFSFPGFHMYIKLNTQNIRYQARTHILV